MIASGEKPHVLIIDDEQIIRQLVVDILAESGFRGTEKSSGEEGLAFFRENRADIDLILLDIIMPGMKGPEVFREVRKIDPEINVLLLSGYSKDVEIETLLVDDNVDFIQKPISMRILLNKIKECLPER